MASQKINQDPCDCKWCDLTVKIARQTRQGQLNSRGNRTDGR